MNTATSEIPAVFVELRSLAKIHLRKILPIENKHPIHAAGLIVFVICEALGKLLGRRPEDAFADYLHRQRAVPVEVGRLLFDAVRNGLAHSYGTKAIVIGSLRVIPTLTWNAGDRRHLRFFHGIETAEGLQLVGVEEGPAPLRLCLDVFSMVKDLNAHFADLTEQIGTDRVLRDKIKNNIRRAKPIRPREGTSLATWRAFIEKEKVEHL